MATVKRKNANGPRKSQNGKSGMVRARIEPALKERAEKILAKIGISPSDAIRVLYRQITLRKGLPFEVRIPTATTRRALAEADAGKLTEYASSEEMLADILGE
jgi:DNA-damage-inducible protein J